MRAAVIAACAVMLAILGGLSALSAEPLAVAVANASAPVACAEEDNVTLTLISKDVRRFRIAAAHPAYGGSVRSDSFGADFTNCIRPDTPTASARKDPKRTTLYEQIDLWVVGLTFPDFWRPATATMRVGDRIEHGLHLIQVWMIRPMGGEEVLVLYPPDGYWRLRPLAPPGRAPTAFGSSFLIGPVEVSGRPIVRIKDIVFEPKTRSFTLAFAQGGSAVVHMAAADQQQTALEVNFDRAIDGQPFAALRSMYVTEFNNDVARIAVREQGAKAWREDHIMAFTRASATDIWVGRVTPSRHNTSSPDLEFSAFSAAD